MDFFAPLLARVGGPKRALVLLVGVAAAALVLGVSRWASQPTWVPAFTGVPLETVSEMTAKLDQSGIQYRLDGGGTNIMVAETDLAKARVALAKGGLPGAGRPGLELFDQPSWGMTDFTQRINYTRALEGELERTIGKMSDVESAQVHLVMHEADAFSAADQPSEASVVLKLRGQPTDDIVQGIAHLVASSVDGLTSDHVTIVDDSGRLLSQADEPNSTEGLTSRQLVIQRQIEEYLSGKATKILTQMVGASAIRVQVSAAMNFDQLERTTRSVDPDKQAVAVEQKAQVVPGAQSPVAGQSNSSTTYDNTRETESYVAAPGSIKRIMVAVLVADADSGTGAKHKSIPRSDEEKANIQKLVASAVGADSSRGDVVTVVSVPFVAAATLASAAPKRDVVETVQQFQRPALGFLGLALAFVVAFLAIKAVGRTSPGIPQMLALPVPSPASVPLPPAAPVRNGIRDRVNSTIEGQPDVAARVVRAWLKES
ncbi:MAG TPA: flagellar basal-body MS-ring/collar protein FliF [Gemmatimonadaceae bacterium]|nr:flagellar basal-body MS-ring/collar protein FliF [Gemmatimonadaceae bacterium]